MPSLGIVTHREGSLTALIQTSFFSRCSGCGVKRVSPRFPAQAAQCAMAGNLHKNVRDATAALLSRPMEQWSILTLTWPGTGHTLPLSHSSSHILVYPNYELGYSYSQPNSFTVNCGNCQDWCQYHELSLFKSLAVESKRNKGKGGVSTDWHDMQEVITNMRQNFYLKFIKFWL